MGKSPHRSAQSLLDGGDQTPSGDKLTRGRLIVALDALLSNRSVTLAARQLGLQTSALSRLLTQLRDSLGDPIFARSGRGLVPTPFAETIRPKVRRIAAELESLFEQQQVVDRGEVMVDPSWDVPGDIAAPQLAVRPATLLEGELSAQDLTDKLNSIGETAEPMRRLARVIGVLGVGGGGHGRPLTIDEAEEAMGIVLGGEADPVQIGALLGMMHVRGTTALELAGFVRAARAHVGARLGRTMKADVDWPCYMSPNYHNPPWFFHAARLISLAGYRVVLHGNTGSGDRGGRHGVIADSLGIPVCTTAGQVATALDQDRIAYIPLAALAPQIYRLIGLYKVMETRSAIFELAHLLKPVEASVSLLGVAKPSYKALHRDAAAVLGWKHISVLESVRDVAQFMPFRFATIYRLVHGKPDDLIVPATMHEPQNTPRPRGTNLEYWQALWSGAIKDAKAEQIVVSTVAFALFSIPGAGNGRFDDALERARELWRDRRSLAKRGGIPGASPQKTMPLSSGWA